MEVDKNRNEVKDLPNKVRGLWIKYTRKMMRLLTLTEVFLNQNRVNVYEHTVKIVSHVPQTCFLCFFDLDTSSIYFGVIHFYFDFVLSIFWYLPFPRDLFKWKLMRFRMQPEEENCRIFSWSTHSSEDTWVGWVSFCVCKIPHFFSSPSSTLSSSNENQNLCRCECDSSSTTVPTQSVQFHWKCFICPAEIPLEFHLLESGTVHGLAFWFDVAFIGSVQTFWLSTAPTEPLTHWYQVRCLLETPIFVKAGQLLTGRVLLLANQR